MMTEGYMPPEQWEAVIANARRGGELKAELCRLARKFDAGDEVGHGVATVLMMLSFCADYARTGGELQCQLGHILQTAAWASFELRFDNEGEVVS